MEAVLPETLVEWVEYDHVADFIDTMNDFPDSDWLPAYLHFCHLIRKGTPLHSQWYSVFHDLRKTGIIRSV